MSTIDSRSARNIATLDPKAQAAFTRFTHAAKAVAATMGCDYIAIAGNRSWAAQDALYAQGRTTGKPGAKVTNARGGYSNHNFGIAIDFGVFADGKYLDETNPRLADKVHRACAEHAEDNGLAWGGLWESFPDTPHYEMATLLTLAQKRERFEMKGSIL